MKIQSNLLLKAILLILSMNFIACTELYEESYTEIIETEFEPGPENVASFVGSAYVPFRKTILHWNGIWRAQEIGADQLVIPPRPNGWVDGGVFQRLHMHEWTTSEGTVQSGWGRTYSAINVVNRVIYQVEQGTLGLGDQNAAILAELRVLRAAYYYLLIDLYGNVPIVTDFDVPVGFQPEQNTRQEVYDFIITEITESLPFLSETADLTFYGRFNKWAAYTLLAKMYLNAEVYTGTPQWQKCIVACDSVFASNAYVLEADQKNVFVVENQTSSEIIFGLAIDNTVFDNYDFEGGDWNAFDLHMQTLQPAQQQTFLLQDPPWGGMCALPQFIDTFHPEDRRLTRNWFYGQQFTADGDTLLAGLGAVAGQPLSYINEMTSITDVNEANMGYRLGKFEIEVGGNNILSNDFPFFRYADIYMMKAEALLRTGDAGAAAALVTEVRRRAFADPDDAFVTGDELMEGSSYDYGLRNVNNTTDEGGGDIPYGRFLDELAWEFNQEGRRRQDMIRFGVFTTKSWFSHTPNGAYRALYPIPQNELANNPNLTQNPGY